MPTTKSEFSVQEGLRTFYVRGEPGRLGALRFFLSKADISHGVSQQGDVMTVHLDRPLAATQVPTITQIMSECHELEYSSTGFTH
jgi:hypothetical protein